MFKLVTIGLVALFANLAFANKFAALDHCTPLLGAFIEPYTGFHPTTTVNGITTINFYVSSDRAPHIQLNASPKSTPDYYELVIDNGANEIRRRKAGGPYNVLGKANRPNLINKFQMLKVRIDTKLQSDGKRVLEVFYNDEATPVLRGVDTLPPIDPNYQSFGSYLQPSKYYYNCQPIPAPKCPALEQQIAFQNTQITTLRNEIDYLLKIIKDAYNQSLSPVPIITTIITA